MRRVSGGAAGGECRGGGEAAHRLQLTFCPPLCCRPRSWAVHRMNRARLYAESPEVGRRDGSSTAQPAAAKASSRRSELGLRPRKGERYLVGPAPPRPFRQLPEDRSPWPEGAFATRQRYMSIDPSIHLNPPCSPSTGSYATWRFTQRGGRPVWGVEGEQRDHTQAASQQPPAARPRPQADPNSREPATAPHGPAPERPENTRGEYSRGRRREKPSRAEDHERPPTERLGPRHDSSKPTRAAVLSSSWRTKLRCRESLRRIARLATRTRGRVSNPCPHQGRATLLPHLDPAA